MFSVNKVCVCGLVQVVVLWVGTNNHEHTAEQVAGGILAIAKLLTSRFAKAKIVVLVSLNVCLVFCCLFSKRYVDIWNLHLLFSGLFQTKNIRIVYCVVNILY